MSTEPRWHYQIIVESEVLQAGEAPEVHRKYLHMVLGETQLLQTNKVAEWIWQLAKPILT